MRLEVQQLSFAYAKRQVLHQLNLSASSGELLALLGSNGAGKSTLLRLILGLLVVQEGTISLDKTALAKFSRRELARKIAYVPQQEEGSSELSVMEMVMLGACAGQTYFHLPGKQEEARALAALSQLGIEQLAPRPLPELSGGERQLVLIARALAQAAPILVLDEPCANLDYGRQLSILAQLRALRDLGYLIIMSTHNPQHGLSYADTVFLLQDGACACSGPPQQVLTSANLSALYGVELQVIDWAGSLAILPQQPGNTQAFSSASKCPSKETVASSNNTVVAIPR